MDKVVVLDFGGQYSHLISRRIRDLEIYSEVMSSDTTKEELLKTSGLKGVIFSGGAASVYDNKAPKCDKKILELDVPKLGICFGHQMLAHLEKGDVEEGDSGEYGLTELEVLQENDLMDSLSDKIEVWMNHKDIVKSMPSGYETLASTNHSPVAAFENKEKKVYGVQFHPEVTHTKDGEKILENFALNICKAEKSWETKSLIKNIIKETKEKIGDKRAVIALSGGIDSSVATLLISEAIGKNLTAVYVDTGLMRYKETETMQEIFSKYDFKLKIIKAGDRFFKELKGVVDPEKKRKIIGKLFIDIFEEEARKVEADVLVQGTIYSDRIESGATKHSANIKSHHNVGGLPEDMKLALYEPLKDLYKDEVRNVGKELGLTDELIRRHVFPGPGFAIRIIGGVTREKAEIVRVASHIVDQELKKAGLYKEIWMAFAVLLSIKSVGIQGDARSYKWPVVLRIIESKDAMTANFAKLPYEVLEKISTRITNEIKDVNRVVYDISNKPPATMEWE